MEAAEALGKSYPTFSRWIAQGMFPMPRWSVAHHTRSLEVYTAQEIAAAHRVLRRHGGRFAYYLLQHRTTIDAVYAAVQNA